MRSPLVLALLLLAPLAAAQVPDLAELRAEDPPLVRPLLEPVVANLTLRASCALVDERGSIPVSYDVVTPIAWATAIVSPSADTLDPRACEAGSITARTMVILTATQAAPAFQPTPLDVRATVGPPGRQEEARATLNVTADYFSILQASVEESQRTAPPGSTVEFTIRLSNLGNGRTRVEAVVENATGGLAVDPVPPVVLGSGQQGASDVSSELRVVAHTPEGGLFVNQVGVVTLRLRAAHDGEPARAGDETRITLLVTTRSGAGGNETPLPALLAVAALVLASRGLGRDPRKP